MADNFNLRSFLTENKLTKNAQLLKEEKFYAPDYISQKYGAKAKEIEQNIFDAEETENNPNLWDNFTSLETPEEVDSFVQGFIDEEVNEARYSDSYDTPAAKAVNAKAQQIVDTIRGYSTALQTIQDAIKQVEQEVGSEATRSEKSTLESHLLHMFRSEMEMERESVGIDDEEQANDIEQAQHDMERRFEEQVERALQESRLTAKERRLVEMVQDALGVPPQAVAEEAPMADDEMVQEKTLPEYKTIDELMSSIEHGTNEAAHKYKMDRMKEVAEALEGKVSSLEEGEHAEHIDQKAVKQMRKDIAALRKAEEKLRKEFDKKFNKKGKAAPAPKAETEKPTLQEGTFDLRKFLAENRKK